MLREVIKKLLGILPEEIGHDKLVEEFISVKEVQPGSSDLEIFNKGKFFCCLAGPRSWMIEAWVKKIRKLSGTRVDWSMAGGRACVSYLGDENDFQRLVAAAELTRPALEEAALKKGTSSLVREHDYPSVQWLNPENPWGELDSAQG